METKPILFNSEMIAEIVLDEADRIIEHPKKPRAKPRVMAYVIDGGADFVRFECKKCGWDSDWLHIEENGFKEDDFRRGIPCKLCNT